MELDKAKVKKWIIYGLVCLIGAGASDIFYRGKESIPRKAVAEVRSHIQGTIENLENRISLLHDSKNTTYQSVREAVLSLEKSRHEAIIFDKKGAKPLQTAYEEESLSQVFEGNTIICKAESSLAKYFLEKLHPEDQLNFRNSVNYMIFSPNIVHKLGSSEGDVNGLSLGEGIILIDSQADDSSKKNIKTFQGVIAHEAQHEEDKGRYPLLVSERRANESARRTLKLNAQGDKDPILMATLKRTEDTVSTALYLEKFGQDFNKVYPKETLLAKDLLEANISAQILRKYSRIEKKTEKDLEMICAASFAEVVQLNSREDAIRELYPYATEEKFAGTIAQISAASAIAYLCPNSCKIESSADVTERGVHLSLQKGQKSNHTGQGYKGSEGYSVSGLPSLQELLEDQRFDEYDEQAEYPLAIYSLAAVDNIKVKTDANGTKQVYLPNKEGKPSPEFFRAYVEFIDANQNGRADKIRVYYFNNEIINENGATLAKIDVYDGLGQYQSSGVTWFAGRSKGRDLPFNAREEALKRNMELVRESR